MKKTKNFVLISGSGDGCYWTIITSIRKNGTFKNKSKIQFRDIDDRKCNTEQRKKHYLANRERILKQTKEYKKSERGKEVQKLAIKKYQKTEKGKKIIRKACKKYSASKRGKESICKSARKYSKTEKGRAAQHRRGAKRRNLGFIELNEWFEGSEAHHIDKEFVLYIPEEKHRSIWHNVWSGQGMEEINILAFEFAYGIDVYNKNLGES